MADRFPYEERTFETRIKFIRDIFTCPHSQTDIMTSCINYKLLKSYEDYEKVVTKSAWNLKGKDPIAVLKQIDSK